MPVCMASSVKRGREEGWRKGGGNRKEGGRKEGGEGEEGGGGGGVVAYITDSLIHEVPCINNSTIYVNHPQSFPSLLPSYHPSKK